MAKLLCLACVPLLVPHLFTSAVTVGFPISLSGVFGVNGQLMLNAASLFSGIAQQSGINITIVALDDLSTRAGVTAATTELLDGGVDIILSPYTSFLTLAARTVTEAATVPVLLLAGAAVDTSLFAYSRGAFGIQLPATNILAQPLQSLRSEGASTVLFASEAQSGLQSICSVDVGGVGLQSLGLVIVNASTVGDLVSTIATLKPDVVVLCTLYVVTTAVLAIARDRAVNPGAWVGVFDFSDPRVLANPMLTNSFILKATSWVPVPVPANRPLPIDSTCLTLAAYGCISPAQYSQAYEDAYGVPSNQDAAGVFAALEVVVQSVTASGGAIDAATLIPIVAALRFSTAFGTLQFGRNSHQNVGGGILTQIQGGNGIAIVSPRSIATGLLVYPSPTWAQQDCAVSGGCGSHGSCHPNGGCECHFGYTGSQCSSPAGIAWIIAGSVLALALLCVGIGLLLRSRWRAKKATARAITLAQAAIEDTSRRTHARTLTYASHELSNPLFQIQAALAEHELGGITTPLATRIIKRSTSRMMRVLQDIASMSHIGMVGSEASADASVSRLQLEKVTLQPFLRDVRHRLKQLHDIRCEISTGENTPTAVVSDPMRLSQLLTSAIVILHAALAARNPSPIVASGSVTGNAQAGTTIHLCVHATPLVPRDVDPSATQPGYSHQAGGVVVPIPVQSAPSSILTPDNNNHSSSSGAMGSGRGGVGLSAIGISSEHNGDSENTSFFLLGTVSSPPPSAVYGQAATAVAAAAKAPTDMLHFTARGKDNSVSPAPLSPSSAAMGRHVSLRHVHFAYVMDLSTCTQLATRLGGTLEVQLTSLHPHCHLELAVAQADNPSDEFDALDQRDDEERAAVTHVASGRGGGGGIAAGVARGSGVSDFTDSASAVGDHSERAVTSLQRAGGGREGLELDVASGSSSGGGGMREAIDSCDSSQTTTSSTNVWRPAGVSKIAPPHATRTVSTDCGSMDEDSTTLRPRALVIDDEQVVCMLVSRMLRRAGWEVDTLSDGAEISPQVRLMLHCYSLVLLDIVMPKSNGVEVCKQLRSQGFTGMLVAMTANTSTTDVQQYRSCGFDGIVGKPFDVTDIRQVLGAALRHRTSAVSPRDGLHASDPA